MKGLDIRYLCTAIGNLSGVPIRIFESGEPVFFYSQSSLPRDPMDAYREEIFAIRAHVGYVTTRHFHYYGIVNSGETKIVIGPTRQIAESDQELRELAFQVDVAAEDIDAFMRMCFWYELSKLYLHLPVAGLGGYSRMEYAEKEHLSNPYLILNGAEDSLEDWKDMDIFGMPFDVQCELYLSAERFVKDGTELSEKRMMKYAKKQIGSEMAAALQIHCCLISGNPRLLTLLEKGAKRGNAEAREMLEEVKSLLYLDE